RGLARPVGAHEHDRFAGGHVEVEAVEGDEVAVVLGEGLDMQQRLAHFFPPPPRPGMPSSASSHHSRASMRKRAQDTTKAHSRSTPTPAETAAAVAGCPSRNAARAASTGSVPTIASAGGHAVRRTRAGPTSSGNSIV